MIDKSKKHKWLDENDNCSKCGNYFGILFSEAIKKSGSLIKLPDPLRGAEDIVDAYVPCISDDEAEIKEIVE